MKKILLALLPALLLSTAYAQEKTTENEEDAPAKQACNSACCKMAGNILYMSPVKFTENGVGFELGFEHGIDKDGIVAYNLPLVATFNLTHDQLDMGNKQDPMFYFMPGLKFYPTSSHGRVKYALGPSLVLGAGQQTDLEPNRFYSTNPGIYPFAPLPDEYVTRNKFLLGVTVNNSLNINPTEHFTMGLDFGFGFTYINKLDGVAQNINGLVQGGFKVGYRF